MNERPIPEAALRDPNAVEMLRLWIAEQRLWTSLNIGVYAEQGIPEAKAWGIILADTARHLANALEDEQGAPPNETIGEICRHMLEELGNPTSETKGGFV